MHVENLPPALFSNRTVSICREFAKFRAQSSRVPARYPKALQVSACELVTLEGLSPWRAGKLIGIQLVTMNSWLNKHSHLTVRELKIVPKSPNLTLAANQDTGGTSTPISYLPRPKTDTNHQVESQNCGTTNPLTAGSVLLSAQVKSDDPCAITREVTVKLANGSRIELTGKKADFVFECLIKEMFSND